MKVALRTHSTGQQVMSLLTPEVNDLQGVSIKKAQSPAVLSHEYIMIARRAI